MCFRIRKRMRAGACREILAQRDHAGEIRARKKNLHRIVIEIRYRFRSRDERAMQLIV